MKLGHCKTCWWYKKGVCYMHQIHISETNYCPDYYSRTKGNKEEGLLSEWIKKQGDIELFD